MLSLLAAGAVDAFVELAHYITREPDHVTSPRGMPTRELRHVVVQLETPEDCTFSGVKYRGWSSQLAVAEALQLIGGFSDPDVMVAVVPRMKDFLEPSGEFWGAYGRRTGLALDGAARKLLEDRDTRQGVVCVYDNHLDLLSGPRKDIPCTAYMNFTVRDDELLMTTHMRSNDLWWGWCYDAFQFTQLGFTLANFLDVKMGPYTHVVDSFHLYERDLEKVQRVLDGGPDVKHHGRPLLTGLAVQDEVEWLNVQRVAHDLFYEHPLVGSDDTEKWMVATGLGKVASEVNEARHA